MIDAVTGGREVTRQEEPRLYNLLENLCISRGITDAEAQGDGGRRAQRLRHRPEREAVFDHGHDAACLQRLDDREVEAVLGHELTHIRNGDVRLLVIAVVIAGVISFFAELVFRMLFQGGFSWRGAALAAAATARAGGAVVAILIALALIAVAWLLSIVIRFALSRKREFLADAGSVELTKNPDAMIIGAAQDRRARRAARRDLGGHGNVRRQSARGLCRPVRHPSLDRQPHRTRW